LATNKHQGYDIALAKAVIDDKDFNGELDFKFETPKSFDLDEVTQKQAVVNGYPYLKEEVKGDMKRNNSFLQ
jgi:hypothetical protein